MTRTIGWMVFLAGMLLSFGGAAQSYAGTNVGAIPDGLGPQIYGPPRDVYFDVGPLRTVSGVSVSFSATHTWVGDLRVTLIAPNGNSHLLFARTGATAASGNGFGTDLNGTYTFTDNPAQAGNWWIGAATNPVPSGFYRTVISGGAGVSNPPPVTSLGMQFLSTPANGRWILRFEDGAAQDTGTVSAATLNLTLSGSTRTVTNANDSGSGSLRSALSGANNGDYIRFATPFFSSGRAIELLTALTIDKTVAIVGPGAELLTLRRAESAGDMRIISVDGSGGVSLSGMTISGGRVDSTVGGGIFSTSPLTLSGVHVAGNRAFTGGGVLIIDAGGQFINSTFSGNQSQNAAAIYSGLTAGTAVLRLQGSTVSGNRAANDNGALLVVVGGTSVLKVEISNSTIADNQSSTAGIGADANGGQASVSIRNSIVANNSPINFETTGFQGASITSLGYNLSNDYNGVVTRLPTDRTGDPKLGPLAPHGGSVPTRLLLGGSDALDAGNASGVVLDQRGVPRVVDIPGISNALSPSDAADMGAVEMQGIVVTNSNDAGTGSLRAALVAANANGPGLDDILFNVNAFTTPQNITLTSALPTINSAITLTGTGADRLSVRRGGGTDPFRIFDVASGLSVAAFSGIKIQNGSIPSGDGGGILSLSPLTLAGVHVLGNVAFNGAGVALNGAGGTIVDSTINGNTATGRPAGIYLFNGGALPLRIVNSTVSGNTATGSDGGIFNLVGAGGSSAMEIINSTIAQNSAGITGGIASVSLGGDSATVEIRNSIVTDNTPQNMGIFASTGVATIRSRGFNLGNAGADATFFNLASDQVGINPLLQPLALNGGSTPTHALILSSAAVDGGDNSGSGVLEDQRGSRFPRPVDQAVVNVGDGSDIGAFELEPDGLFANGFE